MKYKIFVWVCFIAMFSISHPIYSQQNDSLTTQDLFSLSLEELMQIKVSVASVNDESIIDAPAIVSYITPDQMKKMGLTNLNDWISTVPGFVYGNSQVGNNQQMIRGITEAFNQKILFLLDGVPYYQPTHSDIPMLGIPLETIDHVELIRGPGAVIHGTNATGGVINVVTKASSKKQQPIELSLSYGNHNLLRASGYGSWASEKFSSHLGFEFLTENEYSAPVQTNTPDGNLVNANMQKRNLAKSVWGNFQYCDLSIVLHFYESNTTGLAAQSITTQKSVASNYGTLAAIEYKMNFSNGFIKPYVRYNKHYLQFDIDNLLGPLGDGTVKFSNSGNNNIRVTSGVQFNYDLTSKFNILSGYEYEYKSTGDYETHFRENEDVLALSVPKSNLYEQSIYLQGEYEFSALRILLGARYINNELAGSEVTPRLSFVYSINAYNSIKLLFAKGFNSPNFIQQKMNFPGVIIGDESNKAESISSIDFAYSFNSKRQIFITNFYYYFAEDFITRVQTGNGSEAAYKNSDSFNRWGLEIDYQNSFDHFNLYTNVSYFSEGNKSDSDHFTSFFVPMITFNLGSSYSITTNQSAGIFWRFVGARANVPSFNHINCNYTFKHRQFRFSATVENILGDEILTPDLHQFFDDRYFSAFDNNPRWQFTIGYRIN